MENQKFNKAAFEAAKNRTANKPSTPSTLSLIALEGQSSKNRKEAGQARALKRN